MKLLNRLIFKTFFANLLHQASFFQWYRKCALKGKAFIITYHRVLPSQNDVAVYVQPGMYVTSEAFGYHLSFLHDNFNVLSLEELTTRVQNDLNVEGCCAITFDDGWCDNYSQAFPLLLDFQIPVTIFLATKLIGTKMLFWPEELTFYLKQPGWRDFQQFNPLLKKFIHCINLNDLASDELHDRAIAVLKRWTPQDRDELLSIFRAQVDAPRPDRQLMNWEEVKVMQKSGLVTFGAHTSNHVILDQVSLKDAEIEILQSRHDMERYLGLAPDFFAYPNGNYTEKIKDLVRLHGFKGAVSTRKEWIRKGCDPFEIPRISIHQDISSTIPLFQARIFSRWY